jgi:hypothetical protein
MTIYIQDAVVLAGAADLQGVVVAVGFKRKITKMTAHNGTGAPIVLQVYNVPTTGAADATTKIIKYSVAVDETYLCPEAIGAGLNVGGGIYADGVGLSFGFVANDTPN